MYNEQAKNWNNFYLGLAVVVVSLLGIPLVYKKLALVILGLFIALFSLARPVGRARPVASHTASHGEV